MKEDLYRNGYHACVNTKKRPADRSSSQRIASRNTTLRLPSILRKACLSQSDHFLPEVFFKGEHFYWILSEIMCYLLSEWFHFYSLHEGVFIGYWWGTTGMNSKWSLKRNLICLPNNSLPKGTIVRIIEECWTTSITIIAWWCMPTEAC